MQMLECLPLPRDKLMGAVHVLQLLRTTFSMPILGQVDPQDNIWPPKNANEICCKT